MKKIFAFIGGITNDISNIGYKVSLAGLFISIVYFTGYYAALIMFLLIMLAWVSEKYSTEEYDVFCYTIDKNGVFSYKSFVLEMEGRNKFDIDYARNKIMELTDSKEVFIINYIKK